MGGERKTCPKCGIPVRSASQLDKHMLTHPPDPEPESVSKVITSTLAGTLLASDLTLEREKLRVAYDELKKDWDKWVGRSDPLLSKPYLPEWSPKGEVPSEYWKREDAVEEEIEKTIRHVLRKITQTEKPEDARTLAETVHTLATSLDIYMGEDKEAE